MQGLMSVARIGGRPALQIGTLLVITWYMRRLGCQIGLIFLSILSCDRAFAGAEQADISLDYVSKLALERAHKPFVSPRASLPDILRADKLDYDKYREIRFRDDQALWASDKLPFEIEFFHPGYLYEEPVHVFEFSPGYVQPVPFNQDFFDYGKMQSIKNKIPAKTGYAGFRVLYPLNQPDKLDELGAFLGASYFRLLGKGQRYGSSARGLALDCGETDRPEEFPIFTDWWLGKPQPGQKDLHLFALLDSVSCTGAYEFQIQPGDATVADINAIIYFRETNLITAANPQKKPLSTMGWAPLTSMFWYAKNSERKFDDYRPEVHDSDGLLMHMANGELLWRPLNNATVMRHQRFGASNIRGFGLLQRDRNFATYQDIFNRYDLVPSLWVEPRGNWGDGDVHLVELSTSYEGLDNIVAFWQPKTNFVPLQPISFSYSLHWTRDIDKLSPNRTVATRIGVNERNTDQRQLVIDFTGPKLASLPEGVMPEAIDSCSANGAITQTQVFQLPTNGVWRAIVTMQPKPGNHDPIDLRCALKRGDELLTETWTFLWSPP
jgi:periplasmic glucans biosynthesis protein